MKKFQELEIDPEIKRGLLDAGFVETFPIQEKTLEPLLLKKDVIGQAKTGTGKTAAYVIPMLQAVNRAYKYPQALVLAPTRELAVQITQEVRRLGKYTAVEVASIYGGQAICVQIEKLSHGAQVIVGTPGRIIDLIDRGNLELADVKYVVLDEADTMLDMGFIDDVEYILRTVSPEKQISLFSATMPEEITRLAYRYMDNPGTVLVDSDEPSVGTLDQYYTVVEQTDKLEALIDILKSEKPASTIVFCATKHQAHKLAQELYRRFYNARSLHGDLSQNQRGHVMSLFRAKKIDILVATNLASRGIDIPHVDCIINYDVPKQALLYFHRVGRTARAGGSGSSITLVSSFEVQDFLKIKKLTSADIKPLHKDADVQALQRLPHQVMCPSYEPRSRHRRYGGFKGWQRGRWQN